MTLSIVTFSLATECDNQNNDSQHDGTQYNNKMLHSENDTQGKDWVEELKFYTQHFNTQHNN